MLSPLNSRNVMEKGKAGQEPERMAGTAGTTGSPRAM